MMVGKSLKRKVAVVSELRPSPNHVELNVVGGVVLPQTIVIEPI